MDNLLPKVSKVATSRRITESFFSNWRADEADPKTAKIPDYLQSEFTPDAEDIKQYRDNKLPIREPNYVPAEILRTIGPSPLDAKARGIADPPGPVVLRAHNIHTLNRSIYRPPVLKKIENLVVCVDCQLDNPMDVFFQRSSSIRNITLHPREVCSQSLTGSLNNEPYEKFYVLCTTSRRATVITTAHQIIKQFRFRTDIRIGLEVEESFGRLVVSKVHEDSQAEPLALHLDGAQVIAVNGQRVVGLEEFQEAMAVAKESPTVSLLMAAYKGGRGKLEDAFLFDLQKSQGMKSVLTNLFGGHAANRERIGTASTEDDASSVLSRESHQSRASKDSKARSRASRESHRRNSDEQKSDAFPPGAEEKLPAREHRPREVRQYVYDTDEDEREEGEEGEDGAVDEHLGDGDDDRSAASHGSGNSQHKRSERSVVFINNEREDSKHDDHDEDGAMLADKRKPLATSSAMLEDVNQAKNDDHSVESGEEWNHLTGVDAEPATIVPFVTMVCMPPLLQASQRYGKPRQFLQLTNFSQNFILEVNWTDEDGSLVCRGNIAPGQVHFELCSEDHVWTLAAKPNEAGKPGKHAAQSSQQSLSGGSLSSSSQSHNVGYDTDRPAPMLIFRPSPACLADGRCVSMVWYPLVSVSATQTLYSQSKEQNHDKVLPCIHIQLMDPPKSATTSVNVTEQSLARLHRKPLMKTRVLNRWRNKKAHSSD